MSDIQDLIHKTSIDCIKQGERQERERIIKLLEHMPRTDDDRTVDAPTLIALIKGENNG